MFRRFFFWTVFASVAMWYFHEYHPVTFMKITRNIPIISPMMVSIHRLIKPINNNKTVDTTEHIFTQEELLKFNGEEGSLGTYIAILGRVFDVEKGSRHYKKGSSYHVFAGKDASRAFVTGDFAEERSSDDVIDLSLTDLLSLKQWVDFYKEHYDYKGKLIGRYYNEKGTKTNYHLELLDMIKDAKALEKSKEEERKKFPPCNSQWSLDEGYRVWCSQKSGGITREWIGVPRKLFDVGSNKHSCVCINLNHLEDPSSSAYERRNLLKQYKNCDNLAYECFFQDENLA